MYIGAFQGADGKWVTSRYHDPTSGPTDETTPMHFWERRPIILTGIPGESAWAAAQLDGPVEGYRGAMLTAGEVAAAAGSGRKRGRDDENQDEEDAMADEEGSRTRGPRDPGAAAGPSSAAAPAGTAPATGAAPEEKERVLRLEGEPGQSVLALFYPGSATELRVSEAVEVLGIFAVSPELSAIGMELRAAAVDSELDLMQEEMAAMPPTSEVGLPPPASR